MICWEPFSPDIRVIVPCRAHPNTDGIPWLQWPSPAGQKKMLRNDSGSKKKRSQDSIRFLMRLLRSHQPSVGHAGTIYGCPNSLPSGIKEIEAIAMGRCTWSATVSGCHSHECQDPRFTRRSLHFNGIMNVTHFSNRRQSLLLAMYQCLFVCWKRKKLARMDATVSEILNFGVFEMLVKEWNLSAMAKWKSFSHWSGGSACCCFPISPGVFAGALCNISPTSRCLFLMYCIHLKKKKDNKVFSVIQKRFRQSINKHHAVKYG